MKFSFPYTFSNEIVLPTNGINCTSIAKSTAKSLLNSGLIYNLSLDGQIIICDYLSLFNIKYPIKIIIEENKNISITYELKMLKLIQISIILVLLTAFFSSFGMSGFLWFSLILVLVFYAINLIFIDTGIKKLIKSTDCYKALSTNDYETFSTEQTEWMNNINKCPACGENLQIFNQFCPECGLKLPHPPVMKPFDVSKYKHRKISYQFKKKNNNVS